MSASSRGSSGFNLVETMIVAVLFLAIGAALLVMLLGGQMSFLSSAAALQAQEEARKALDNVVRDLRGAVNLSCAQEAQRTTTNCPNARLNFQLVWYDAALGTVDAGSGQGVDNLVIHYALVGTQLLRYLDAGYTGATIGAGACDPNAGCRVVANDVNSASFDWNAGTRMVTVTLETSVGNAALPGGAVAGALRTGVLTTRVKLRHNSDP